MDKRTGTIQKNGKLKYGQPGTKMFRVFFILINLFIMAFLFSCGPEKPVKHPVPKRADLPDKASIHKAYKSENWQIRSNAIVDAIRINDTESISIIFHLLKDDPHPSVKAAASVAMAHFHYKKAGSVILGYLKNKKCTIPDRILIDALGQLEYSPAALQIISYLKDSNHTTRLVAVAALEKIGNRKSCYLLNQHALQNKDDQLDKTYAMALGKTPCKNAERYLITLAQKAEAGPTLAASYLALGRIQSMNGIPVLLDGLKKDFPKGRENAETALVKINSIRAIDPLFKLTSYDRLETRWAAARIIPKIQTERTKISSSKKAYSLFNQDTKKTKAPAAYILCHLKYKTATKDIITFIKNPKAVERDKVVLALGWMQDKSAIPVLIEVLQEKKGESRYNAALSLGYLNAVEALPALKKAAASSDSKMAANAIEALSLIRSPDSLQTLTLLLKKDNAMSVYAAGALGANKDPEAVNILTEELGTGSLARDKAILNALANRKSSAAIEKLIEIVKDDNPDLRKPVYFALRSITGEKIYTKNEWLNWYIDFKKKK